MFDAINNHSRAIFAFSASTISVLLWQGAAGGALRQRNVRYAVRLVLALSSGIGARSFVAPL